MDPLAHTLFGATLAESGLKRRTRYATATLLIGANLPDVDAIAGLWGGDFELHARRGWTHGVLAMVLLPLLLAAGVWLWHRWRGGGPAAADTPPLRPRIVLGLAFLSVWSHPALDWLNTYGVRLLMPFDGRWFYGDTFFIIEPWFWLLMAAGVVMARSSTWRSLAGWALLAVLSTAVVLATDMVPPWVKIVWCLGVMSLALLRWLSRDNLLHDTAPTFRLSADNLARAGLIVLLAYIGVSYTQARLAESRARAQYADAQQVQSNPAPGNPFIHRLLVVERDRYVILAADGAVHELPRQQPDAIVRAALDDPAIKGFANWLRFPQWTVEEQADHWIVNIRDLRYQGPDMTTLRDFATISVTVPKSGSIESD